MKRLLILLCIVVLTGCAIPLRDAAHTAIAADAATTAIGISSGVAHEANPLLGSPAAIVASIGLRIWLVEYVNKFPEPQRTEWLSKINGAWWGVVISNIMVLASASNPISFAVGILSGWAVYKNALERAELGIVENRASEILQGKAT